MKLTKNFSKRAAHGGLPCDRPSVVATIKPERQVAVLFTHHPSKEESVYQRLYLTSGEAREFGLSLINMANACEDGI